MFKPVSPKVNFPELEEELLKYWKENKTFEKSVENRPKDKTWTFLDGPPFVTGLPHYGSLLSSLPKDVFPRYQTMRGYRVPRIWGWDGHGLPAENKVETKLGLKSKREIEEKIGVKKFIDECKAYVDEVSGEWEWYVDHIGRWVDFQHAYRTWDLPYMESVMWVFKQLYDKGLIYKGLRVSLYCPHDGTPISNFEVAMDADNYKNETDPGTTYKYPLVGEEKTFILAWSTTPWNKIVTPALAVNPEFTYVKVKQGDEYYILAETTIKTLKEGYEIVEKIQGKDLIGKKFVPHYDYYKTNVQPGEKVFEIIGGDFVTADEGTGVVTIAAYGEEDLIVMQRDHVHIEMHLEDDGVVKADVPKFGGMYYLKANDAVEEDLESRGLIYKTENFTHKVATCWRCHTRLYYAPQDAWYVNVQTMKKQLAESNEHVNWIPKHFKHGRFLKSLENAPDWNISRSRYWGSPVPVWECPVDGERFVPGSIKELEDASGQKINDLHKPEIDEVIVKCPKCGKNMHRVPEVLDSWIEAGSASFGERHYPFETGQEVKDFYPPDFIGEYTGQIRAWFYVLHVIANGLHLLPDGNNMLAKNVLVEGVILGNDGRKMSKNFKNYPDPKEMIEKYGGDALRLYLLGSPVMNGEDILISEEQYRNQVKGTLLVLWNIYYFFVTYANIDGFENRDSGHAGMTSENVLDRWMLSLLHRLVKDQTKMFDHYDTISAVKNIENFVNEFSTWYIRRSRDRIGPSAKDAEDKNAFYATCYSVLTTLSQLMAPLAPFISDSIYRNLTNVESVHLTDWPVVDEKLIDQSLESQMQFARKVVEVGHSLRKELQLKLRQPLSRMAFSITDQVTEPGVIKQMLEELNVKTHVLGTDLEAFMKEKGIQSKELDGVWVWLDTTVSDELKAEGEARDIVRKIQEERKKLGTGMADHVKVTLPAWPEAFTEYIKTNALVDTLTKGEAISVERV
jgi:isoleucyl-tRNA synthetase